MNEAPKAHLRCASCTVQAAEHLGPGETVKQAEARLRADLGANCPRKGPLVALCPMRSVERAR